MRLALCSISLSLALFATTAASLTNEENQRIVRLEESLVAPCCYREPVSRHQSDVAVEMRAEITRMVLEAKSDRQILDYYRVKFGEEVFAEPQGMEGWVVRGVPFLVLLLGVGLVIRLAWKWRFTKVRQAPQDGSIPGTGKAAQDGIPEEFQLKIERELRDRHV
jgi:cytochrome c-type biogenesis protein CcmH/NrfF